MRELSADRHNRAEHRCFVRAQQLLPIDVLRLVGPDRELQWFADLPVAQRLYEIEQTVEPSLLLLCESFLACLIRDLRCDRPQMHNLTWAPARLFESAHKLVVVLTITGIDGETAIIKSRKRLAGRDANDIAPVGYERVGDRIANALFVDKQQPARVL